MPFRRRKHRDAIYFLFYVLADDDTFDWTIAAGGDHMALTLFTNQKVTLTAVAKDAQGNVDPNAVIVFTAADATNGTLVDQGAGNCEVTGTGTAGTCVATATATDPDGNTLSADFEFDFVVNTDTTLIEFTPGTPVNQ